LAEERQEARQIFAERFAFSADGQDAVAHGVQIESRRTGGE